MRLSLKRKYSSWRFKTKKPGCHGSLFYPLFLLCKCRSETTFKISADYKSALTGAELLSLKKQSSIGTLFLGMRFRIIVSVLESIRIWEHKLNVFNKIIINKMLFFICLIVKWKIMFWSIATCDPSAKRHLQMPFSAGEVRTPSRNYK